MIEEIKSSKVYTPKETRDFLKVSDSTMKRMIKNGIIRAYKVSGQHRIWGAEILKLLSPELGSGIYKVYRNIREKTKETIKKW
ncbi:MAG: hypothetical protein US35_C0025G0003 [Parcubacteria group bacterium GW2011_GWA2_37_10]|nr:MAG: hypothetical protein US35_C0025G0003 [Parcubacteria group bacterium GW2011_GWA2_37_10]